MLTHEDQSHRAGTDKITILSDTAAHFSASSGISTQGTATCLKQYARHLQSACKCLHSSAQESLACFSLVIEEALTLLIDEKRILTKNESLFLQKIPDILSEYALLPGSRIPDAKFLRHLKNKHWIRPISATEEATLLELLLPSTKKSDAQQNTRNENARTDTPSLQKDTDDNKNINHYENQSGSPSDKAILELTPDVVSDAIQETILELEPDNNSALDDSPLDLNDLIMDVDPAAADTGDNNEIEVDLFETATNEPDKRQSDITDTEPASLKLDQPHNEQPPQPIRLITDELTAIIKNRSCCTVQNTIEISALSPQLLQIAELAEHISNKTELTGLQGISDSCRIIAINLHELANRKTKLSAEQISLIEQWPLLILFYLQNISTNDNAANQQITEYLDNTHWPTCLTVEDKLDLQSLLASPELKLPNDPTDEQLPEQLPEQPPVQPSEQPFSNSHATEADSEENNIVLEKISDKQITLNVSAQQQELITLIGDELDEVIEDEIFCKIPLDMPATKLNEHLISIAELIEHISNAMDMIGLEGLGNSCRIISSNVHTLAFEKTVINVQHKSLIEQWASLTALYLKKLPAADRPCGDESHNIMVYLANSLWPDPLTDQHRVKLYALLNSPQLKEEEKTVRQNTATADDVSLELPDNANNELLDALLLDLPIQTEEFSNALQSLHTQNNIQYLDVAQRIAHTLKGASNVVGVRGLANLTHHLEDILEIQSKAKKIPSTELYMILSDAADCLETMSEALLGINEPPDNSREIFQSILDWANKLDTEGATEKHQGTQQEPSLLAITINELNTASSSGPGNYSGNSSAPPKEAMLRVPVTLADELLRLAGENLISTSQVHTYIKTIKNRYDGLKTHNQSLQKLSFELEHMIDTQGILNDRQTSTDETFDPLEMDEYHELHAMSRHLIEIAADAVELTQLLEKDLGQLQSLVISQDKIQKESQGLVLRTRMVPTKNIIPRLKRGVKQTCRQTNKQVELEVQHNNTQMDSEMLQQIIEPLMHILRNAIDHGIEPVDQRTESGKKPAGLIKLSFISEGDQIKIEIADDGQGLDTEKIRQKAIKFGIIVEKSEVDLASLHMLVLSPGFTTRDEVDHVSGRGIGLDVVNSHIRELKGSLEINSIRQQGCTFTLVLPVSSFSTQSLLIRVRDNTHTFSNRGVEEILYPGHGVLQNLGHETFFNFNDKIYNTCLIEDLLNLEMDRRDIERDARPVILIKDDTGGNMAILVQEVLDSQHVVVKSMGPYMPKLPGIIGATVLGDGSISPVIDIPELLQSANAIPTHLKYPVAPRPEISDSHDKPSYVLVVDDSLSARKSLAQFVQDLGLEVRTARDGMEAVSLIDAQKPDLILVDMEMPRMNGLELTSHIRASAETQDMPVIMITSRSTNKHRENAFNKGVNHYMVKPFEEDELAMHIQGALKSAC